MIMRGERAPIYRRVKVKQALSRSGLPDIDYALNPYAGCYHGCIYCYARAYTRYKDAAQNWGQVIYIKENIVDVLRKEVRRKKKGIVGISTITDPYQPIEKKEMSTRRLLKVLLSHRFRVDIQTKSPLVLRDLDILLTSPQLVEVGFTITTLDSSLASVIEPKAPSPKGRVEALEKLSEEGVTTWIFMGPIIPGVSDDYSTLKSVIEIASATGSTLIYDWLRLRPGVEESLRRFQDVLGDVIKKSLSVRWRKRVEEEIIKLCALNDVGCNPAF